MNRESILSIPRNFTLIRFPAYYRGSEFKGNPHAGSQATAHTQIVRLGLIHVPEGRKLFPEMSVLENLLLGAYCTPAGQREERLEQVFSVFPVLKGRRSQIAGTLSGGEQQMVAIGRGLMAAPKLLMLDEPSLGLSPLLVEEMFRVVEEVNRLGMTILLVEQNTEHALSIAHHGFVMESGRIALSGSGKELLANPDVRKAYLGL